MFVTTENRWLRSWEARRVATVRIARQQPDPAEFHLELPRHWVFEREGDVREHRQRVIERESPTGKRAPRYCFIPVDRRLERLRPDQPLEGLKVSVPVADTRVANIADPGQSTPARLRHTL